MTNTTWASGYLLCSLGINISFCIQKMNLYFFIGNINKSTVQILTFDSMLRIGYKPAFEEGNIKYGNVGVDEFEDEHFERQTIFVLSICLPAFYDRILRNI